MRAVLTLIVIVASTPLWGVACGADSDSGALDEARAAEQSLVIVSLQFQGETLRVHGDAHFTLVDAEGIVLAEHVTRAELEAIAPDVVQRYDQMVAGAPIDASLDLELVTPSDPFAP